MYRPINYYFIHYPSKQNLNGESPVFCRIVDGKKRKQFSTGILCKSNDFIKSKNTIKGKNGEIELKNKILKDIINRFDTIILEYKIKDTALTIDKLYNEWKGVEEVSSTLLNAFCLHNGHIYDLVGRSFTRRTYGLYQTTLRVS